MTSPHKRPHDDDLLSSASSKRSRLVQDELAPMDCQDLVDDQVLSYMKRKSTAIIGGDLPEQDRLTLFQIIISNYRSGYPNSPAYCVAQYKHAAQLLEDNASLGSALEEAWKERSFTQITSSVFFQKGPVTTPEQSIEVQNQIAATEKAWKCSFKGEYAEVLKDTILKEIYEANILTVIQSSGAGKSRTVCEVGKTLYSVYINLREAIGTGYPSRDPALCEFIKQAEHRSQTTKMIYCIAFLYGIFDAAISVLGIDNVSPEAFRERLFDQRSAFDAEAAKKAREYLVCRSAFMPLLFLTDTVDIPMAHRPETSLDDAKYRALLRNVLSTIDTFATAADLFKHSDVVLLAIDECHTLNQVREDFSTYEALCRVICDLRAEECPGKLFVIFVSTNLQTRCATPAPAHDPSSRVVRTVAQLDPYTAFPFDIDTDVIVEDTKTADEVCDLKFLCSFGRPLWLTRYESGDRDIRQNLVTFAKAKLRGNENFTKHTDDSMFAALSMRHLLTFEPDRRPGGLTEAEYQDFSKLEHRQVALHMRTVHSIPSHRQYIRTGTPSEPILVEAAAQLLPDGRKQLQFLANELNPLVSEGERGELAARLLCNLSHDAAVLKLPPSTPHHDNIRYTRPIPLIAFLEALINPTFHEIVLDSCPTKGGHAPLREAFKESYVHFTHWAKMGDASCLSTKALWKAAARGIAWQCCNDTMDGIDQIIPIILDHRQKIGRGNVSALLIRDQNVMAMTRLKRNFGATTLFADAPGGVVRPYIVLTMQLGGRRKVQQQTLPSSTRESLQYDIAITGCSSSVYRVIHDDDRPLWDRLLESTRHSFEEEHTRKHDSRHLDLLKRTKPFFWESEASFDWARDSDGIQEDEEEQECDVVTVGLDD